MSLEGIFGKFYLNRNMGVVLAEYLPPESIIKMVRLSKRSYEVYSQDIIWWIHIHKSFPELRYAFISLLLFRVVENFMIKNAENKPLRPTKTMKAYVNARKCRA